MNQDWCKARALLDSGSYTCVVCAGDNVYTAVQRGVKPLLFWMDSGVNLDGFWAADRVVGRATAFLYCLLGVEAVYARVMSRPAAEVLSAHGIVWEAEQLVDGIINRQGTGPCPFEEAVRKIDDPTEALAAIRKKLATMGTPAPEAQPHPQNS